MKGFQYFFGADFVTNSERCIVFCKYIIYRIKKGKKKVKRNRITPNHRTEINGNQGTKKA